MSTLRELIRNARRSGHDTLAVASDPETLVALAKTCRRRALAEADAEALETWAQVIDDLSTLPSNEEISREWLDLQLVELDLARQKFAEGADAQMPANPPSLSTPARARISEETRQELAALVELAWATGVAARKAHRVADPSPHRQPPQS